MQGYCVIVLYQNWATAQGSKLGHVLYLGFNDVKCYGEYHIFEDARKTINPPSLIVGGLRHVIEMFRLLNCLCSKN